jgi:hypothetical protein
MSMMNETFTQNFYIAVRFVAVINYWINLGDFCKKVKNKKPRSCESKVYNHACCGENGKFYLEIITRPLAVRNELRTQKERQTFKKSNMLLNPLKLDLMKVDFNFEENV